MFGNDDGLCDLYTGRKAECDFSSFFLMNLNKKKKMFFLSVMHIIRNTWVCVLFRKISAGVKSVSGSFCGD